VWTIASHGWRQASVEVVPVERLSANAVILTYHGGSGRTNPRIRHWEASVTWIPKSARVPKVVELRGHEAPSLMKSRRRVADHGEVFTPPALVEAMLDLVRPDAERIDSRFLEPACGSGNFLIPVLKRKLSTVGARYGESDFEMRHQALLAVMSLYGIELLADNVAECRKNLLDVFGLAIGVDADSDWRAAAVNVLHVNIVHGDALSMTTQEAKPEPISFAEWSYLGKGKYHRRDFRFDTLTQMSAFGEDGTLFADLGKHEIFMPTHDHGALSVGDIAKGVTANV
jgi:hypothetical protein